MGGFFTQVSAKTAPIMRFLTVLITVILLGCPLSYGAQSELLLLIDPNYEASALPETVQISLNNLLYTLKQVDINNSTIQLEEMSNNWEKSVIVSLTDETSKAFLDTVLTQKTPTTRLVILPMLTRPNPDAEAFLRELGFQSKGLIRTQKTLPLHIKKQKEQPQLMIPEGTPLLNITSDDPMIATWGKNIPAMVSLDTTLVINANWQKPLTTGNLQALLTPWGQSHQIIARAAGPEPQVEPKSKAAQQNDGFILQAIEVEEAKNTSDDDGDVTPPELYEFNVVPQNKRPNKETIRKRRSKDTQNALAEYYNDRMRELANIYDIANTKCVKQITNDVKYKACTTLLDEYSRQKSTFEDHWFYHRYPQALAAYTRARDALNATLFDNVPSANIEGRAIWLDRGSIVRSESPEGLRQLIQRIASSGFNVIYFETINAGYAMYPSKITKPNPQIHDWDPLAVAIEEAHKQGVELHAWVWVFAVGNKRHNKILEVPDSFAGPILTNGYMKQAMRGSRGELVPARQHEYWLSPASPRARNYLTNLFSEIVKNYDVDGLQLDYIRYPFQNSRQNMGVEASGRFRAETGLGATNRSEFSRKAWSAWRAFQVSTFVRDLSKTLKRIDPDLHISAAVFPMPRYGRMMMIQQDWETWVRNGWIDTIVPMAYSKSPRSLQRLVEYVHTIGNDKTLVYPGLSLIKLNAIEMLDSMEIARNTGVMGTTLFAFAHFDQDKQLVLQSGPYRGKQSIPPHKNPLYASQQLINETNSMIRSLMASQTDLPGKPIIENMDHRLETLQQALETLTKNAEEAHKGFAISTIQDESQVLKQEAEQWIGWSKEDRVLEYQAKALQQMVDKTVRMMRYATYQLKK